mmetsp:Transcript_76869/g.115689  ORF Transcript_76869/g.115689 Transcript_76869/m.115689 type:complete len:250 (+) Transcript_76869:62-811(+)
MIDTKMLQMQTTHAESKFVLPLPKNHDPADFEKVLCDVRDEASNTDTSSCASSVDEYSRSCNFFTLQDKCFVGACQMTVVGESPLGDKGWCISGRMDALGGQAVLLNQRGKMLSAVVREKHGYRIFSTKPLYPGQSPQEHRIRKKQVYLWATVEQRSRFSSNLDVRVEGGPNLKADISGRLFGRYSARVTNTETKRACGTIRHGFEKGNVAQSRWEIMKSSSQNPQLMICLAAIINRSMGRIVYDDNHI